MPNISDEDFKAFLAWKNGMPSYGNYQETQRAAQGPQGYQAPGYQAPRWTPPGAPGDDAPDAMYGTVGARNAEMAKRQGAQDAGYAQWAGRSGDRAAFDAANPEAAARYYAQNPKAPSPGTPPTSPAPSYTPPPQASPPPQQYTPPAAVDTTQAAPRRYGSGK